MKPERYRWFLVVLLMVVGLLNYLDRQVIFSLLPPLTAEFHLSDIQLGLLGTAFLWVYGAASPLGGFLADRFNRRAVILASLAVWSAVTWWTGHARTFEELLSARALMGLSEACYIPAGLAMISDYHGDRTRSLATGVHQSGIYAGIILGGAAGGWLGQLYGWRIVFQLLGAIGVVYSIFLFFALRSDRGENGAKEQKPRILDSCRTLFSSRAFQLLAVVNTLGSLAYWMAYTWLPLYLYEQFHMDLKDAGFTATFYIQAAAFVAIIAGGWASDRWGASMPGARGLVQALGFLAAGPGLFLVGSTVSQPVLIATLILFGIGKGLYDCNLMPVLAQIAPPHLRATGYGIFNMTSCLAGGVMAMAAGALKSTIGLGGALQISGIVMVMGGLLLLMLGRVVKHGVSVPSPA
ncbi:MAG: MFS transporter [Bryobacteraceae bacterium]